MQPINENKPGCIGIGLRHSHIEIALSSLAPIDFVEIHAENYFAKGGALHQILEDIADSYPISIHATAMGLASATAAPKHYLDQLIRLHERVNPILFSDHAAFGWGLLQGKTIHAGDLLPPVYNSENLAIMVQRVDHIQQLLGRQILVENLSSYLSYPINTMSEPEFLVALHQTTGCGLLVDINNILVNAFNDAVPDILAAGMQWLQQIPEQSVGEIHLAGFSHPFPGQLAVDDHAQPVSEDGWALYRQAVKRFGPVPTLIEWDNQLPAWDTLIQEANKARHIIHEITDHE